nr:reverse transcriptase domain-containing protein [Tanacetum cinerariifolium]
MARMDAMTIKMDAQYKELQSCAKKPIPDLDEDHMPMSREEDANSCKLSKIAKFLSSWDNLLFTLLMHIDVIDEILEEDFDALLDEGSKILLSIEGTLLEEEIFSEFDKFMAMTADENSKSQFNTDEPPFDKITINTDYKIKTSIKEPPMDLELKPLSDNLEYVFLEEPYFLPVIISSKLSAQN